MNIEERLENIEIMVLEICASLVKTMPTNHAEEFYATATEFYTRAEKFGAFKKVNKNEVLG